MSSMVNIFTLVRCPAKGHIRNPFMVAFIVTSRYLGLSSWGAQIFGNTIWVILSVAVSMLEQVRWCERLACEALKICQYFVTKVFPRVYRLSLEHGVLDQCVTFGCYDEGFVNCAVSSCLSYCCLVAHHKLICFIVGRVLNMVRRCGLALSFGAAEGRLLTVDSYYF